MREDKTKKKKVEVVLTEEEEQIRFAVIKEDFSCRQNADVLWTALDKAYKRLKKSRRNELRKELGYPPEPDGNK